MLGFSVAHVLVATAALLAELVSQATHPFTCMYNPSPYLLDNLDGKRAATGLVS